LILTLFRKILWYYPIMIGCLAVGIPLRFGNRGLALYGQCALWDMIVIVVWCLAMILFCKLATKRSWNQILSYYGSVWPTGFGTGGSYDTLAVNLVSAERDLGLKPEIAEISIVFGTVLNRFCVQAVTGHPLTVYGAGGQTRGILNILDTLACVELALLHPADPGEFRVFNQFTESLSVQEMADLVVANYSGHAVIEHSQDPRVEKEDHYYRAAHTKLLDLGLIPHLLTSPVIQSVLAEADRYKANVDPAAIRPTVEWRNTSSSLATSAGAGPVDGAPAGTGADSRVSAN